jgi:type IV pilus assembly protein PilE
MKPIKSLFLLGHMPRRSRSSSGFTLIESMVTVALVAILAAVAYPSYLAHITRANRSAAESYLLEVSTLQQRYLLDARSYAADMTTLSASPPSSVSSSYAITTAAKAGTTPPGFTVTATPVGAQLARDTQCGVLSIDEAGARFYQSTLNDSAGLAACWR